MAQQTTIRAVLTTCSFTHVLQLSFNMGNEGLDCWTKFTLIGYDNLASIAELYCSFLNQYSQIEIPHCFKVLN